jgi:hypothetical protein
LTPATIRGILDKSGMEVPMATIRKQTVCRDGFTMSVQASAYHYCSPRVDGLPKRRYTAFEVGFPSQVEPLLLPYMEPPGKGKGPCDTVYGYVPAYVVRKVVKKHGGVAR